VLHYLHGDATHPQGEGTKLIVHVVNTKGGWGRGFVCALSRRWPYPEEAYREWYRRRSEVRFELGDIQMVAVWRSFPEEGINNTWVVNMLAQEGYGRGNISQHRTSEPDSTPPIRYEALRQCLHKVAVYAKAFRTPASIHAPRIGCGLAGGSWDKVEPIILETLGGLDVYVYDYP
jgi:O-acetyl-ADP-ribose deacetylase (regulator of RNase III)